MVRTLKLAECCVKRRIAKSEPVKQALVDLLSANAEKASAYDLGKDLFGPHTNAWRIGVQRVT